MAFIQFSSIAYVIVEHTGHSLWIGEKEKHDNMITWELHSRFSPTLIFQTDQLEGQQTNLHEPYPNPPT